MATPDGDERQDFGVLLSLAQVTFSEGLKAHMRDTGHDGFTTRIGFVLRLLVEAPLSLRGLADRLRMTPQATLKLVDQMSMAGYVVRTPSHLDRRLRMVEVSDRGHAALADARLFHEALERSLVTQLGPDTAAAVRAGLEWLATQAPIVVPGGIRRERH